MNRSDKRFLATLIFEHSTHHVGAVARLYRVSAHTRAWWDALLDDGLREGWPWHNVKWCLCKRFIPASNVALYEVLVSFACRHGDTVFLVTMLTRKYGNDKPIARRDYERYLTYAERANNRDIIDFIALQLAMMATTTTTNDDVNYHRYSYD